MKIKISKKQIIYVAVAVVIIIVVVSFKAIKTHKEKMEQFDVTPSTAQATTQDIGIYIPASGTISSGNIVSVLSETEGTVTDIYYNAGDFVNAGDGIAVVAGDTLLDQIEVIQSNIDSQRSSIDEYENETQDYTIKSPVKGRVKEINAKYVTSTTSEYNRERAEDIEEEYGYLVSIAVGNYMYIKATEDIDQYEVGEYYDAVIHEEDGDERIYHDCYADKIENGAVYIYVNTNIYDDNVSATIYTSDGKSKLGEGVTEYLGIEYVVGAKGYIEVTSTYTNQLVNEGDILYYSYSNMSQNLIEMYTELEIQEEDLADLQTQYANLEIVAPVSGFIQDISIVKGESISSEGSVCTIADTSIWTATVDVDELDVNSVEAGMLAAVTIDAIPDEEFEGTVTRISSVGANTSGVTTYTVEIEVPADERFKLSMNASSEIEVQKVEDVVSVPIQAVRYQGNQAYVLVYAEHTDKELKEIKDQILDAQKQAEKTAQMSQEEIQEQMAEMREQVGANSEKDQGSFDPEEMQGMMSEMSGRMNSSTSLSVADQLYGEMVVVEVGIQDETNIQIISGLESGDVVLLPTTESESTSSTSDQGVAGMMGGGMIGGGMMGGGRP